VNREFNEPIDVVVMPISTVPSIATWSLGKFPHRAPWFAPLRCGS